jgi:hypothetical protein
VASFFKLTSVTSFGKEFYVLFTDVPFDSSKTHIVVLDSDLKIINKFTLQEADNLSPPAATPFVGNQTMVDFNGLAVIGNLAFIPYPSGFSYVPFSKTFLPSLNGPCVSGAPLYFFNETNFRISGGNLLYDEYDDSWGPTTSFNPPLGTPSPPPQSQLQLLNVITDHDSSLFPDLFIFHDNGSERTYFLFVPKLDIDGGLSVALPDVFSYYPPPIVKYYLAQDSISFTYDGVIAYDQSRQALVRFKLDDPENVSALPMKWSDGMKVAVGVYGGYCVVWNPVTRTLTRYEKWW